MARKWVFSQNSVYSSIISNRKRRYSVFKLKTVLVLALAALLVLSSFTPALATIDTSLIDKGLEKFNELSPSTQKEAIDLLKTYFKSSGTLEVLKQDLPSALKIVLGDDYEAQLEDKGLSVSRLKSQVDELKSWSYEDRMAIIDKIQSGDSEGIADLVEKYKNIEAPSDPSGGSGTAGSSTSSPASEKEQETDTGQEPTPAAAFTDITNHWAKTQIEYIAEKGIIQGKASGIFAPEDSVTRAEFTAMMVRLLQPEISEETVLPFLDVAETDWFYETVKTAYAANLAKGKGDLFDPEGKITREEMTVLVARAAALKGKSVSIDTAEIDQLLLPFKDKEEISDWAKTETAVALKLGLVRGTTAELFQPKANASRAEAAVIIYNLYGVLNGESDTMTE